MKLIITPRRHARPLAPGERLPTPEENDALIAASRREMARTLVRRFPQAKVLGIEGASEIVVDLPDSEPDLPARIRASLDVETGPAPGSDPSAPVWRDDIEPTADGIAAAALDAQQGKAYRPVAVAVVRDRAGRLLFVRPLFGPSGWTFLQAAVREEHPLETVGRALRAAFGADRVSGPHRYVGTVDVDAEEGRPPPDGFTKGERHFVYEATCRGSEAPAFQGEGAADARWVEPLLSERHLLPFLSGHDTATCRLLTGILIRILCC